MRLIIPMAGNGLRFSNAGYDTPKPLLDIHGKPMIRRVIDNLMSPNITALTLIYRPEQIDKSLLELITEDFSIEIDLVALEKISDGPADSVSQAIEQYSRKEPLVVANSDQYLNCKFSDISKEFLASGSDGLILTMTDSDPKWSYIEFDGRKVTRVREKEVISSEATVGIYFFKELDFFRQSMAEMKSQNDRVNGEFYVAPLYNYLIKQGLNIEFINLGLISQVMHGLGTPEDYEEFVKISRSWNF